MSKGRGPSPRRPPAERKVKAREGACLDATSARNSVVRHFNGCRGSPPSPNSHQHYRLRIGRIAARPSGSSTTSDMTRHGMAMHMASELSSELTRIIDCPYPASLSVSLHRRVFHP
jgi:hypothetical protein